MAKMKIRRAFKKKHCRFCADKVDYIDFKDIMLIRRYMSDKAKIKARRATGNCSQHQRQLARAIKRARYMALLPYVRELYR
jgi:small subunit ribosomal protein S18